MKRRILTVSAAALALLLAGFGPPELPSEQTQVVPPPIDTWKSWIPDAKPKPGDSITAKPDLPREDTHTAPGLKCARPVSAFEGTRDIGLSNYDFHQAYEALLDAGKKGRPATEVDLAEKAIRLAKTREEWTLVEQARFGLYMDTKDRFRALRTVEALISLGCVSDLMKSTYQQIHVDLRRQLGMPPG